MSKYRRGWNTSVDSIESCSIKVCQKVVRRVFWISVIPEKGFVIGCTCLYVFSVHHAIFFLHCTANGYRHQLWGASNVTMTQKLDEMISGLAMLNQSLNAINESNKNFTQFMQVRSWSIDYLWNHSVEIWFNKYRPKLIFCLRLRQSPLHGKFNLATIITGQSAYPPNLRRITVILLNVEQRILTTEWCRC